MRAVGPGARTPAVHREGEGASYTGLIHTGTDHAEQLLHLDATSAASPAEPAERSR